MISRALFLSLLARVLIVRIEYRFESPDCTDISMMLSSMIVSFLLSSERARRGGVLRTACNACIKINSAYTILITWHAPFRASTSLCTREASQTRVWPRVRSPVKHRRWELRDSLDIRDSSLYWKEVSEQFSELLANVLRLIGRVLSSQGLRSERGRDINLATKKYCWINYYFIEIWREYFSTTFIHFKITCFLCLIIITNHEKIISALSMKLSLSHIFNFYILNFLTRCINLCDY